MLELTNCFLRGLTTPNFLHVNNGQSYTGWKPLVQNLSYEVALKCKRYLRKDALREIVFVPLKFAYLILPIFSRSLYFWNVYIADWWRVALSSCETIFSVKVKMLQRCPPINWALWFLISKFRNKTYRRWSNRHK